MCPGHAGKPIFSMLDGKEVWKKEIELIGLRFVAWEGQWGLEQVMVPFTDRRTQMAETKSEPSFGQNKFGVGPGRI